MTQIAIETGGLRIQQFTTFHHMREFSIQARQMNVMNVLRQIRPSVTALAVKGRGRVLYKPHLEAEVASHPGRGRHTMVCRQASDDQFVDASSTQLFFERRAYERTVHVLDNHKFTRERLEKPLKFSARLTRPQRRIGFQRKVLDMVHGSLNSPPRPQQLRSPLLCMWVVAPTPAWVSEPFLHVDQDQCCRAWKGCHHAP